MSETTAILRSSEVRPWLEDFARMRRTQVESLIALQGLIFILLASSLMMIYIRYSYNMQQLPANSSLYTLYTIPVLWFAGAFWLRKLALVNQRDYLHQQFLDHDVLARGLGDELMTGGDGRSFRARLQQVFRSLPRILADMRLQTEPHGGIISRSTLIIAALLVAWMSYLHLRIGVSMEIPALCILLVIMLLDFRRRLSRIVLDLVFAQFLLGTFELPIPGIAPPPPPPPPEHI